MMEPYGVSSGSRSEDFSSLPKRRHLCHQWWSGDGVGTLIHQESVAKYLGISKATNQIDFLIMTNSIGDNGF